MTSEQSQSSSLHWEHCKFHRHLAMLSLASKRHRSESLDEQDGTPNQRVDTFYPVDCIEDALFNQGDKFIDKNHSYKFQAGDTVINFDTRSTTNVTVLHYNALVPKKQRKEMTPRVCFNFCRHMEDMYFFGIKNGRECYCTPFYQPMPDDTSECDISCEGDSRLSCGGLSKSSIFQMHTCADSKHVLHEVENRLTSFLYGSPDASLPQLKVGLYEYSKMMNQTAATVSTSCGTMLLYFEKLEDPISSQLMKRCISRAGEVQSKSWDALALAEECRNTKPVRGNFSDYYVAVEAEKQIEAMETSITMVESMSSDLQELWEDFKPAHTVPSPEAATHFKFNQTLNQKESTELLEGFTPAVGFVDKNMKARMPAVCGGVLAAEPSIVDERQCGALCSNISRCLGFTHFEAVQSPVCFLFSKLESFTYYPRCTNTTAGLQAQAFLQSARSDEEPVYRARCHLKSSKFQGKPLSPDPTGKCKTCLKMLVRKETTSMCRPR